MPPLISAVVCTYNRCDLLQHCIRSLQQQTYPNVEIVVVNGPSTDGTNEYLESLEGITIVNQAELSGLSHARNLGIEASNGDVIAFIDDDAAADSEWLSYLSQAYDDPHVGGCGGLVYGPKKETVQFRQGILAKSGIAVNNPGKITSFIFRNAYPYLMGTNCSFRKDILLSIGGFDRIFRYFHDESDICIRVQHAGYHVIYDDRAFVIHETAIGHNRGSLGELNYRQIAANSIYFTMKNFGAVQPGLIMRSASLQLWWMGLLFNHMVKGNISIRNALTSLPEIPMGAREGYRMGKQLLK